MAKKLQFFLTKEEIVRCMEEEDTLYVDVHGLHIPEVKRLLKNIGAICSLGQKLCIIHGYNNGTSIKEMLNNTALFKREYVLSGISNNPGRTIIQFI